jgi:ABC-type Fe3+-hydroxamate transport system substrate-binding protein
VQLRQVTDDLGTTLSLGTVTRVVSLVPSLTESIAVSAPELLVGATDWCTHPADLDVTRTRGTKNPNVAQIVGLEPDLVVCNQEENRQVDVQRLRAAGCAVWVTRIETLDEAFDSLRRLFTAALDRPIPSWLTEAEAVWSHPEPQTRLRAVVPIWRDPWMVVGRDTFTGDLLSRLGIDNACADQPGRYPQLSLEQLTALRPELVVLPDEPYLFTPEDGPDAFPGLACALVSGRSLTWYGPSLASARPSLLAQLHR